MSYSWLVNQVRWIMWHGRYVEPYTRQVKKEKKNILEHDPQSPRRCEALQLSTQAHHRNKNIALLETANFARHPLKPIHLGFLSVRGLDSAKGYIILTLTSFYS